jgi:NADH-quinone oxidoreductase subunit G
MVGVGVGTNLLDMGKGDAIVVVASDLHEEAPVWWLRVKAAAERGAALVVVNGRQTRLDNFATHPVRYAYGEEVTTLNAMLGSVKAGKGITGLDEALKAAKSDKASKEAKAAAGAISGVNNLIVFVGSEGLDAANSDALAQAAANLLIATGHTGRANNGLIIVWTTANGQGASDMGLRPDYLPGYQPVEKAGMGYADILAGLNKNKLKAVILAGVDPVFDDPDADKALRDTKAFIVVQDMFLTATAELADVVLPTQGVAEREGTYTSGERRVQRFYPAIEPIGLSMADWEIAQMIGERLGQGQPSVSAAALMYEITGAVAQYAGVTYQKLAEVVKQFPDVGGEDLYYGGTAFQNTGGLGIQWPSMAETGGEVSARAAKSGSAIPAKASEFVVVPIRVVYDAEPAFARSEVMIEHIPVPYVGINPADAKRLKLQNGAAVSVTLGKGWTVSGAVYLDEGVPKGVATLPRRLQAQGAPDAALAATLGTTEKVRV